MIKKSMQTWQMTMVALQIHEKSMDVQLIELEQLGYSYEKIQNWNSSTFIIYKKTEMWKAKQLLEENIVDYYCKLREGNYFNKSYFLKC